MPSSPKLSLTELINGAAGLITVVGGLVAATCRSFAILRRLRPETVDRVTAAGFLAGAAVAAVLLATESMR
jgi:hypothetical protein